MNNTNSKLLFAAQLGFTFLICAFLVVPLVLSILAGITDNYFVGLSSGLTFDLNFRDLFIAPEGFRIVGFDYGYSAYAHRHYSYRVRAVRGPSRQSSASLPAAAEQVAA